MSHSGSAQQEIPLNPTFNFAEPALISLSRHRHCGSPACGRWSAPGTVQADLLKHLKLDEEIRRPTASAQALHLPWPRQHLGYAAKPNPNPDLLREASARFEHYAPAAVAMRFSHPQAPFRPVTGALREYSADYASRLSRLATKTPDFAEAIARVQTSAARKKVTCEVTFGSPRVEPRERACAYGLSLSVLPRSNEL